MPDLPRRQGLYDPRFEHDACGVAFVVDMKGRVSHDIVEKGLRALCNLDHRGAAGAEPTTGDGAGILIQVPDRFFRSIVDADLPPPGGYATGMVFLPADDSAAGAAAAAMEKIVEDEGFTVLAWRDVPTDDHDLGATARAAQPSFRQLFVAATGISGMDLERRAFVLRKRLEHEVPEVYLPSLSGRTFVYKGMLTTAQLSGFFPDLADSCAVVSIPL